MCEEHNIPKVYDPASAEKKWYKFWGRASLFSCRSRRGQGSSVLLSPPNITGQPHMGYALDNTLAGYPRSAGTA